MAYFKCDGYWKVNPAIGITEPEAFTDTIVCDGTWDGIEDAKDAHIFFYTDGLPVVDDHGEFVITKATGA